MKNVYLIKCLFNMKKYLFNVKNDEKCLFNLLNMKNVYLT